jgi:hypothetical protein
VIAEYSDLMTNGAEFPLLTVEPTVNIRWSVVICALKRPSWSG